MALFDEKYGDQVRLVRMGDYSRELCGGTHVLRTGEIGAFRIVSEGSIGTGLRRIEAVAGRAADAYIDSRLGLLKAIEERLPGGNPLERLDALQAELTAQRRELTQMERAAVYGELHSLLSEAQEIDGKRVLAARINAQSVERMREMGDWLRERLGPSVVIIGSVIEGRPIVIAMVSEGVKVHAGDVVKEIAPIIEGKGGGRPNLAQAGGLNASKLDEALVAAPEAVRRVMTG
jgi:alanyl-tRNA synthetase